MSCYYRFIECRGDPHCPHSEVELDGLDREEYELNREFEYHPPEASEVEAPRED